MAIPTVRVRAQFVTQSHRKRARVAQNSTQNCAQQWLTRRGCRMGCGNLLGFELGNDVNGGGEEEEEEEQQ